MAVQKAYERLQMGAQGGQGPQPWRLLLLLKVCLTAFDNACDLQLGTPDLTERMFANDRAVIHAVNQTCIQRRCLGSSSILLLVKHAC